MVDANARAAPASLYVTKRPPGLQGYGDYARFLKQEARMTAELIAYCFFGSYSTAVTEAIGPLTTLPECRSVKEKPTSLPDFLVE